MFAKPVVLGLLAAACVTAAAGGAYVAVRQNESSLPVEVRATEAAAPAKAVAETEALVAPATPTPELERAPVSPATADRPSSSNPALRPAASSSAAKKFPARTERPIEATRSAATVERPARPVSTTEREVRPQTQPVEREARIADASTPASPVVPALPEPALPEPPPAPAKPQLVEVVVPASSVVGLKVETALSSETARVEDRVEARVTREVMADDRVAIPAGARILGDVIVAERGGKMKEKARLGVRFHTLVLADGHQVPFRTDAIFREGASPGAESARKIGGAAIGGAVLGAIIGGAKGAAIGGATGAAGGSAVVMAGDRNHATLPFGTILTVRLTSPVVVEVEKDPQP
jgi:hypothetical protein